MDQLSGVLHLFFPLPLSFTLIFFSFTLNWAAKKKRKKGVKYQHRGSIRSSRVYEVFFKAFEKKHLSGGGMRPNCSQSLLILPVQSPNRPEGEGGEGGGCGWELQTPSFDLLSVLTSFES